MLSVLPPPLRRFSASQHSHRVVCSVALVVPTLTPVGCQTLSQQGLAAAAPSVLPSPLNQDTEQLQEEKLQNWTECGNLWEENVETSGASPEEQGGLHSSKKRPGFPQMLSLKERQPGSGRWSNLTVASGASGRVSEAVEPGALCWVWEGVWGTAGCRSPG